MTLPEDALPVDARPEVARPVDALAEVSLAEDARPGGALPGAAVIDGVDVDAVAAAVLACAGVSALVGGQFGEVVSYLPGRKVAGVLVRGGRVKVQVRSRWGVPAADLAALIRVISVPVTGYRPVDVVIADIDDPPGAPSLSPPALSGCE